MKAKSIFLKPGKEKAIKNRHPWVFSGAIGRIDDTIESGDEVLIKDSGGNNLALGHWCAGDGLVCRIFSFDIHATGEFFKDRLIKAHALRKALDLPSALTTGYRLVHGEGDGLSGLVCDIFNETASIQLSNPGLSPFMGELVDFLKENNIKNIYLNDHLGEGSWLLGNNPDSPFLEHGLKFVAHIGGQKTGHFLDQRENRKLVQSFSHGRDVLDAFCHSGGFSIYALKGGARSVLSVDTAKPALDSCKLHVALNSLDGAHKTEEADCFSYLRTLKKDQFDLIVLDPPAFAKSVSSVSRASRGYKDINLLALKAIRSGGLLFTYSCSQHIDADLFQKIIFAAAKDSGREVRIIKQLEQASCHPVSVYCPQSFYLKGLMLYVE